MKDQNQRYTKQQIRAKWRADARKYEAELPAQRRLEARKKKVIHRLTVVASLIAVICMLALAVTNPLAIGIIVVLSLIIVCFIAYSDTKAPSVKGKSNQITPTAKNHDQNK